MIVVYQLSPSSTELFPNCQVILQLTTNILTFRRVSYPGDRNHLLKAHAFMQKGGEKVLNRLLDLISEPDSPAVRFHVKNHLCMNIRSGRHLCRACEEICPVQGIQQVGMQVKVEECIGCSQCALVCPTGVFDDLWTAVNKVVSTAKDPRPYFWITCQKAPPHQDTLQIHCLGELTPELLLYPLWQGIPELYVLYQPEMCEECLCVIGHKQWKSTRKKLSNVFHDAALPVHVMDEWTELPTAKGPAVNYSRRGFLRAFTSEAGQVVGEMVLKNWDVHEAQAFEQSRSLRRKLLIYTLSKLDVEQRQALEPDYLQHPIIEETCSFCASCITLCPAGALQIEKYSESHIGISVDPIVCTKCGLCTWTCPEKAITLDQEKSCDASGRRLLLVEGKGQRCRHCHKAFWGSSHIQDQLCPSCRIRHRKPKIKWQEALTDFVGGALSENQ